MSQLWAELNKLQARMGVVKGEKTKGQHRGTLESHVNTCFANALGPTWLNAVRGLFQVAQTITTTTSYTLRSPAAVGGSYRRDNRDA